MIPRRHNSDFFAHNDSAPADSDEDLTHDQVRGARARSIEIYQQAMT
jgi:hypothetical protein